MKPDDVLRAVAETGGVIGHVPRRHITTLSHDHPAHTIDSVMDHFQYCVDMVGLEHVAFRAGHPVRGSCRAGTRCSGNCSASAGWRSGPAFDPGGNTWTGWRTRPSVFGKHLWLAGQPRATPMTTSGAVLGGNIYRVLQSIWGRAVTGPGRSRGRGPLNWSGCATSTFTLVHTP